MNYYFYIVPLVEWAYFIVGKWMLFDFICYCPSGVLLSSFNSFLSCLILFANITLNSLRGVPSYNVSLIVWSFPVLGVYKGELNPYSVCWSSLCSLLLFCSSSFTGVSYGRRDSFYCNVSELTCLKVVEGWLNIEELDCNDERTG